MSETEERIERFERFEIADYRNRQCAVHRDLASANKNAAALDLTWPQFAPHRVVHLVELRPGERVVSEEAS